MRVMNALSARLGEEQKKKEEEEKKEKEESCGDGSPRPGEVVVAVAVRTLPLMALQRSTRRATPLERRFRFILIFAGDAQAHRQLLRIPRGCESIIPLVCRKTSAFRGWYCGAFRLLIAGVARAARFVGLISASLWQAATDTGHREKV